MKFTLILFPAYSEFLSEERADAVVAGGGQRARRLETERHLLLSGGYTHCGVLSVTAILRQQPTSPSNKPSSAQILIR